MQGTAEARSDTVKVRCARSKGGPCRLRSRKGRHLILNEVLLADMITQFGFSHGCPHGNQPAGRLPGADPSAPRPNLVANAGSAKSLICGAPTRTATPPPRPLNVRNSPPPRGSSTTGCRKNGDRISKKNPNEIWPRPQTPPSRRRPHAGRQIPESARKPWQATSPASLLA